MPEGKTLTFKIKQCVYVGGTATAAFVECRKV